MIDRELMTWMQGWFEQIVTRLDRIEGYLEKMAIKEKLLEGERLLDNQDVCQKLNISKRTLQRYRSSDELPYQMLYHKTFYKESDVEAFMKAHFGKDDGADGDGGSDHEDTESNTEGIDD